MTAIWWIRRDLRLTDNSALHATLETASVIPVFILDPGLLSRPAPRRQAFLFDGLRALDADLRQRGSYLVVRRGKPIEVLPSLLAETGATSIYAEEDYTPYARNRDAQIACELPLQLVSGQTILHPDFVEKADGSPYTVFTPYSKAWKAILPESIDIAPAPDHISTPKGIPSETIPAAPTNELFPAGETEATRRLKEFATETLKLKETKSLSLRDPAAKIHQYAEGRDRMDLDGVSTLSPYIRFGMLGLRQAAHAAQQAMNISLSGRLLHSPQSSKGPTLPVDARNGAETLLNQLIWREFYIQILYHFPHASRSAFNPSLADIPWRNNEVEFDTWKAGQTGYPIVDAAMRQLRETGWMHNRARMIAASFLVKDLLVDWRWGEAWFMERLLDGDPAANNGGWQWTAGTGTDAAPYFRIFNPMLQSRKFDPHGNYIRKWVSELSGLSGDAIHAPWEYCILVPGYPQPLVNHKRAKERALQAYQFARSVRKVPA